jgi:hypothetical protein
LQKVEVKEKKKAKVDKVIKKMISHPHRWMNNLS